MGSGLEFLERLEAFKAVPLDVVETVGSLWTVNSRKSESDRGKKKEAR